MVCVSVVQSVWFVVSGVVALSVCSDVSVGVVLSGCAGGIWGVDCRRGVSSGSCCVALCGAWCLVCRVWLFGR